MDRGKHSNLLQSRNWSEMSMSNQAQTATVCQLKEQVRYAEWVRQYEEQKASGLSVTEWCKENGINPSTYYHRLRKIREVFCDKYVEPIEPREPFQFEKTSIVPLKNPVVKADEITIEYGGIKMRVTGEISAEKLCAIIGVLRSC